MLDIIFLDLTPMKLTQKLKILEKQHCVFPKSVHYTGYIVLTIKTDYFLDIQEVQFYQNINQLIFNFFFSSELARHGQPGAEKEVFEV